MWFYQVDVSVSDSSCRHVDSRTTSVYYVIIVYSVMLFFSSIMFFPHHWLYIINISSFIHLNNNLFLNCPGIIANLKYIDD